MIVSYSHISGPCSLKRGTSRAFSRGFNRAWFWPSYPGVLPRTCYFYQWPQNGRQVALAQTGYWQPNGTYSPRFLNPGRLAPENTSLPSCHAACPPAPWKLSTNRWLEVYKVTHDIGDGHRWFTALLWRLSVQWSLNCYWSPWLYAGQCRLMAVSKLPWVMPFWLSLLSNSHRFCELPPSPPINSSSPINGL